MEATVSTELPDVVGTGVREGATLLGGGGRRRLGGEGKRTASTG